MKYAKSHYRRPKSKVFYLAVLIAAMTVSVIVGIAGTRVWYERQLKPASNVSKTVVIEIPSGASVQEIADNLQDQAVIRSSQAFQWFVRNNDLADSLKAGTYELDAAYTTPEIIDALTIGKVQENLVTILPGQRLDQIEASLIKSGFSQQEVTNALKPSNYTGHPALVAKPTNQSLEGYISRKL